MKQMLKGAVLVLGLAASGAAAASGAWTGRAGLVAGGYSFEADERDLGCCGNPGQILSYEDNDVTYGIGLGTTLVLGRVFADYGIEFSGYKQADDFYRTDGLLTLGVYIGDRWTVFGGYRSATFGDGFSSESGGNTERGPFLGAGLSFRAGNKISLGTSLAYNFLTLSYDGTTFDDVDLTGFSAKGQMNFIGTPHAVFLRYQRFNGDYSEPGYEYEYTENYLNVGYQATFDFSSW